MRFIIVIVAAMLTGCGYQTVSQNDIQTAIKACGTLESIERIESWWVGSELVHCNNRQYIRLDERVWNK